MLVPADSAGADVVFCGSLLTISGSSSEFAANDVSSAADEVSGAVGAGVDAAGALSAGVLSTGTRTGVVSAGALSAGAFSTGGAGVFVAGVFDAGAFDAPVAGLSGSGGRSSRDVERSGGDDVVAAAGGV